MHAVAMSRQEAIERLERIVAGAVRTVTIKDRAAVNYVLLKLADKEEP